MDLGICPNCGVDWANGREHCSLCGYVAIGAGLSRLPKKAKKSRTTYREPGSINPLSAAFFALLLIWSTSGGSTLAQGVSRLFQGGEAASVQSRMAMDSGAQRNS